MIFSSHDVEKAFVKSAIAVAHAQTSIAESFAYMVGRERDRAVREADWETGHYRRRYDDPQRRADDPQPDSNEYEESQDTPS